MESEAEKNSDRTGQTISLSILLLLAVTYSLYSFQANEQTYRLDLHDLKNSKKSFSGHAESIKSALSVVFNKTQFEVDRQRPRPFINAWSDHELDKFLNDNSSCQIIRNSISYSGKLIRDDYKVEISVNLSKTTQLATPFSLIEMHQK